MAAKKKGLGRGLDALLPEADELLPNVVQEIPVGDIDPNTEQPRRSFPEEAMTQLSASVKEQGILQPLLVVEQPAGATALWRGNGAGGPPGRRAWPRCPAWSGIWT